MLRCLVVVMVLFTLAHGSQAQQEANVYLIKIFECTHKPVERSQTGFRVKGLKGIVTALHGVADCKKITVSSKKGLLLDQPLVIKKIDADHDVVLLSSSQIDSATDEGFNVADNVAWESLGAVKVYGHPYGISNLETPLTLRNPPLKPLKDLVPATPLSILKERRSPNHLINVLNLLGNLLPGHSGAPILDSRGRVVAVANGGLKEGFAGISWAIPFQDIEWDDTITKGRLKLLAQLDPNVLFATDALPAPVPEEVGNDFCEQLSSLYVESKTGFISIVGDPILDNMSGAFRSKLKLPGATSGVVIPPDSASYLMYQTDKIAKVESQYYQLAATVSACLPAWERKEIKDRGGRYMFRENNKSATIHVSYYLELQTGRYRLDLIVYASGVFTYLWG